MKITQQMETLQPFLKACVQHLIHMFKIYV